MAVATTGHTIGQRELRNDNAEIMRRVEAGERFVVTRNGKPIADLVPHAESRPRHTLAETQAEFRKLPRVDAARWHADRVADDEFFGADDPTEDPWRR
ncbi:type II toxin-antitoxin system Phd/YefM family antitoxin [Saccharothrix deserti]|uniref:type II toxin-antitoxin system Phd/YefM family antitoxin n=1 Tax=Saccharothrix deserti TaxID=2593674 RepID=UPI00131D174C|nr:type II toxin-antitoxin system prevent-host-death family antitoxin [Saccharothrix deserti]